MIEHLKGRERALAALGWTGREAEWIALGLSPQWSFHAGAVLSLLRDATGSKTGASRFVQALVGSNNERRSKAM